MSVNGGENRSIAGTNTPRRGSPTDAPPCPVTFGPHTCGLPAQPRHGMHKCPLTCIALDHACIRVSSCEPGNHTGTGLCEMAVDADG